MTELTLVRGLPGSGKTTFAMTLVALGYFHIEADMYFMQGDVYQFMPTMLGAAHKWCQKHTIRNLLGGHNVVVSNTFTTMKEIKEYVKIANDLSVPLNVYKATGNFKNVHNVPEEALARMKARWVDYPGEIVLPIPQPVV